MQHLLACTVSCIQWVWTEVFNITSDVFQLIVDLFDYRFYSACNHDINYHYHILWSLQLHQALFHSYSGFIPS